MRVIYDSHSPWIRFQICTSLEKRICKKVGCLNREHCPKGNQIRIGQVMIIKPQIMCEENKHIGRWPMGTGIVLPVHLINHHVNHRPTGVNCVIPKITPFNWIVTFKRLGSNAHDGCVQITHETLIYLTDITSDIMKHIVSVMHYLFHGMAPFFAITAYNLNRCSTISGSGVSGARP